MFIQIFFRHRLKLRQSFQLIRNNFRILLSRSPAIISKGRPTKEQQYSPLSLRINKLYHRIRPPQLLPQPLHLAPLKHTPLQHPPHLLKPSLTRSPSTKPSPIFKYYLIKKPLNLRFAFVHDRPYYSDMAREIWTRWPEYEELTEESMGLQITEGCLLLVLVFRRK
jgi:hypothetical protein